MDFERIALKFLIVVNIVLFIYSMIYYPHRCSEISILSGGLTTCGLTIGAYLLAIVLCVVATVAAICPIKE